MPSLALSRIPSVPAPTAEPTDVPLEGAADLEALVPAQIGGVDVTTQSMSGNDLAATGDIPAELTAALAGMGKAITDVRMVIGFTLATPPSSIIGVQIGGQTWRRSRMRSCRS